jgi:hypothetical protein
MFDIPQRKPNNPDFNGGGKSVEMMVGMRESLLYCVIEYF